MRRSSDEVYPLKECQAFAIVTIGITDRSKGVSVVVGGNSLEEIATVIEDRDMDRETVRQISSKVAFRLWKVDGLGAQSAESIAFGGRCHREKKPNTRNQEGPSPRATFPTERSA